MTVFADEPLVCQRPKQGNAVAVTIYPAFPLLLGRQRLCKLRQPRLVYALKIIRKALVKGVLIAVLIIVLRCSYCCSFTALGRRDDSSLNL
jgi:hypothetical protein